MTMAIAVRTVRVRITGRVQGVGYRAWVEAEAINRGLDGWVRNRRDGAVEAVFSGPALSVADMLAACRKGPPAALVDAVEATDTDEPPGRTFRLLPTE
jgi:acylphosphatase